MFPLNFLFWFSFVQFSTAFNGPGGLFGYVFRYQRICFCRCGVTQLSANFRNGRMNGGQPITPHQFPWLASINIGDRTIGGTLLSDRHVITAASPLYGIPAGGISVTLGTYDRCNSGDPTLNSSVEAVVMHPAHSPSNTHHDIALLRLRHAVPFSQYISPVCLPNYDNPEHEQVAWTVSWANESNESDNCIPRVATLPMIPKESCSVADNATITLDKRCLGPAGAKSIICETDVGAPVMTRRFLGRPFRLVGVISSSTCDRLATPLYTRVLDHVAWIQEQIHNDCQCF